jgi:hypothetical protein
MTNPKILDPMMSPNALSMNANSNPKAPFARAIPRTYQTYHATPMCPLFHRATAQRSRPQWEHRHASPARPGEEGEPFYRDAEGFGTGPGVCLRRSEEKARRERHGSSASPNLHQHNTNTCGIPQIRTHHDPLLPRSLEQLQQGQPPPPGRELSQAAARGGSEPPKKPRFLSHNNPSAQQRG